jgi:hypothetical protein
LDRVFLYLLSPKVFINKPVDFRMLRLGLDVDLSRKALNADLRWVTDSFQVAGTLKNPDNLDVELPRIVKSSAFASWTVEELLKR